jgi:hypothetical protein
MKLRSTLFLLVGAACATTSMQTGPEPEYTPTGEVVYYDRIATFDATHVQSPNCSLRRRDDGSWGGVLAERPIDVSVNEVTVKGADFLVSREDSRPGKSVITGQFQGRIFRFELTDDQVSIRTSNLSAVYPNRVLGERSAKYGTRGEVELRGEASGENPPWPQFAFALMSAFY